MAMIEFRTRYRGRDRDAIARLQVLFPLDLVNRLVKLTFTCGHRLCQFAEYPVGQA